MKRGMILLAVLALSACSVGSQKSYYQLPTTSAATTSVSRTVSQGHQLWVQPVSVTDLLGEWGWSISRTMCSS